jgi:hypothetical protein
MATKKTAKRDRKPRVVIEVTERRKAKYEQAANVADLQLSEWCRRVLDEAAAKALADELHTAESAPEDQAEAYAARLLTDEAARQDLLKMLQRKPRR